MVSRKIPSTASLQCFEAAARHLSFTDAAKELCSSQSAVSKQVAVLESMLECEVFVRDKQGLELTPTGKMFLPQAQEILHRIEESVLGVMAHRSAAATLRIVTHPTFGARWLVQALKGFGAEYPHIHLDVHDELGDFCSRFYGDMDIGFLHGGGTWPGMKSVKLFGGHIVAVCAPSVNVPPLSKICQPPKAVLVQSRVRPWGWQEYLSAQGVPCANSLIGPRFDSFSAVIHAAIAGCGFALVPEMLVQQELQEGRLKIAWPHRLQSNGAYYMVYPVGMENAPKVRAMTDWIRAKIEADGS